MMEVVDNIDDGQLPVFAKKAFLDCRSDQYGWICDNDFVLPFIVDKRYIFKRLIFTTEVISRGKKTTPQQEQLFLNNAIDLIKNELQVDMVAKAQSNAVFNSAPDNANSIPWGSYQKDIQLSDEELMLSIKSKTRNMVRRAFKGGVKVEEGDYMELWTLMQHTFKRQGEDFLAPSLDYVKKLKQGLKDKFLILKAVHNGTIQGIVGIPFDDSTAYYLFGGSAARPHAGALNFLQFESMKKLRDMGVSTYDFVGARIDPSPNSKYYNIQKFKTSFNPDLKQGYAFKVIFKPMKYRIMNLGIYLSYLLKRKRYEGDPIDQVQRQGK
ncbi:lipid II:glycine glycyltransferase FemX [Flagellimonas sp. 2504JD4-2]